jgi:hypothetical protein
LLTKVLVCIPALDGKFDARWVDSMFNLIRAALDKGIDICPFFVTNDALVQRVRNDLFHTAYISNIETAVFLDSDMSWAPDAFFKLLLHNVDIVGATARKKTDDIVYAAIGPEKLKVEENGLIKVQALGMAFTKFSRKAIVDIYEKSPEYYDDKDKTMKRMVFNVTIENGIMYSEDVSFTRRVTALGYDVWLDPTIKVDHIGLKVYESNFMNWAKETGLLID